MSSKTKKLTFAQKVSKHKQLIPFVIPAILFALVFCYLPMAGIVIAFKDNPNFMRYDVMEALQRADWTLDHFKMIISDPEIFKVVRNTLIISVMKIVILFPLPVFLAVMITELRSQKFSKLVQGLVFLPHFFSWVVIVGIFNSLFGLYGPINNIVEALGGNPTHFMGEPLWFRWLVVILSGWKEIGYSSIVYIAAIMSIDPSLYEAAKIDGASKLRQIWNITIPSIMPTIMVMLILNVGSILALGFEKVLLMYTPINAGVSDILDTLTYRTGLRNSNYSYATAIGLFSGVVGLILVSLSNYISKKTTGESIY